MCRYRFLCELITHTLYFCYLFSFLLFLSFFSLHFFWFYKSNIHNKCGIWSHLRKGCYKRISCPKFEFVMYFKNSWFLEKIFFILIWQKLWIWICITISNFWHQIHVQLPFLVWVDNPHLVFLLSFFFSLISLFLFSSFFSDFLKATYIPSVAYEVT